MPEEKKTIKDRVLEIQAEVKKDPGKGDELRKQAILAMYKGMESDAWKEYMGNFATTPEQLTRLTTLTGDHLPYVRQARCYLIANAMCLPGTDNGMLDGIDEVLDKTLP
ncbi:MAG: hypothetical protein WCD76_20460 [Pyrinomonadaceae bacterium]